MRLDGACLNTGVKKFGILCFLKNNMLADLIIVPNITMCFLTLQKILFLCIFVSTDSRSTKDVLPMLNDVGFT